MNIGSGTLNSFNPIIYNPKTKKYIVSWGLKNIGGDNYKWNYEIFSSKPSLDLIKSTIIGFINTQTKNCIENKFKWNDMYIKLSIEKQIDYTLLYNTTKIQNGSNLPEKVKFKINEENVYYTFENIEDMENFIVAMNDHIRKCLEVGNNAKESIKFEDYII